MERELRAQQTLEVRPENYCRNILKHFLSAVDRIFLTPPPDQPEAVPTLCGSTCRVIFSD